MNRIWAGIDSGKTHHHCLVLDHSGERLLSHRVANDEPELLKLLASVLALGDQVTWAVDMAGGEPALLLALLVNHGKEVLYIPGRVVNRASDGYRGEGKTDARDAFVIADQARIRRDLQELRPSDEAIIELRLLTNRRADLVRDRTRSINRLRSALTGMFPALERALVLTSAGPLVLLAGYQTPAALRRLGTARLTRWLRTRGVRSPEELAKKAVEAAERQHTCRSRRDGDRPARSDARPGGQDPQRARSPRSTSSSRPGSGRTSSLRSVASMPGIGPLLGAEFLAAIGNDLANFASPDGTRGVRRPSSRATRFREAERQPPPAAPLSPRTPTRLLHVRPDRASRYDPNSRAFYDRKRAEGKRHTQAVIALARRRVNVLWALIRDGRLYEVASPRITS